MVQKLITGAKTRNGAKTRYWCKNSLLVQKLILVQKLVTGAKTCNSAKTHALVGAVVPSGSLPTPE